MFSRKLLTTLQVVQPKSIYTSFIDLNTIKSIFNWIQMNKTKGFQKYLKIFTHFHFQTQLKPFFSKNHSENYFIHLLYRVYYRSFLKFCYIKLGLFKEIFNSKLFLTKVLNSVCITSIVLFRWTFYLYFRERGNQEN